MPQGITDVLGLGVAASAAFDEVNQVLDSFDRPFLVRCTSWTDPDGTVHSEKQSLSLLTVLGLTGVFILFLQGIRGFPMIQTLLGSATSRVAPYGGSAPLGSTGLTTKDVTRLTSGNPVMQFIEALKLAGWTVAKNVEKGSKKSTKETLKELAY